MLAVKLNLANYEYDVHSLVKAFYPEKDVKVVPENEEEISTTVFEQGIRIWFKEAEVKVSACV